MHFVFEPGFFSSSPVQIALVVGAVSAIVSAVVGVFTVLRGQSFAGHALTDVATTGGSGAFFYGASPLVGFLSAGVIGAGAMELVGVERLRGRDIATGVVLGFATGLSALFLYLDTTKSAATGVSQQILFGSIFTLSSSTIPLVAVLSALTLCVLFVIYRPLLLSSVSPDLAAARGIRVRLIGVLFMLTLAVSVGLSSIAIGSILSTALLIGPAAAALRVTTNLRAACGRHTLGRGGHLAGHCSRLRQLLLVSVESGPTGQLLHRGFGVRGVSALGCTHEESAFELDGPRLPLRVLH